MLIQFCQRERSGSAMASTFELPDKNGRVKFEGALTVGRADEIRTLLMKALADAGQVFLDLGNVTDIDLAGLQLLYSAFETARQAGKQLSYAGKLPGAILKAAEEAGYERIFASATK